MNTKLEEEYAFENVTVTMDLPKYEEEESEPSKLLGTVGSDLPSHDCETNKHYDESDEINDVCVKNEYEPYIPRKSRSIEQNGQVKKHMKEKLLRCDKCNYITTTKTDLKKHIQGKHEGFKYPCPHCDYKTGWNSDLKAHIKNKHEGKKFSCDKCDFVTGYSSYFRNHVKEKHEGVRHYCDQCDFQTGNLSYLKVHKQSKHEGRIFSCEKCDFKTKWQAELRKHIKGRHDIKIIQEIKSPKEIEESLADQNGVGVKSKEAIDINITDFMKIEMKDENGDIIDFKFLTEKEVGAIKNKGSLKCLQCNQCSFTTGHRSNLRIHIKSVHEGFVHKCQYCEYVAPTAGCLKTHIESKHMGIRHHCQTCDYTAGTKSNLQKHIQTQHTNIKFKCSFCESIFKCKSNLKKHTKALHTDEEQRQNNLKRCSLCDFSTLWSLSKHMRYVHNDDHQHKGDLMKCLWKDCDYITYRNTRFDEHVQLVHGVLHKCEECGFETGKIRNIKNHQKKNHPKTKQMSISNFNQVSQTNEHSDASEVKQDATLIPEQHQPAETSNSIPSDVQSVQFLPKVTETYDPNKNASSEWEWDNPSKY